jgi:crotonobetainyl-CoA:carnitine CoA-transferase CaiB-like acyl-CoA transferase
MWLRLCSILDLEPMTTDSRFLTNADRMKNRHVLKEQLEVSLKRKTRMEWTPLMIQSGIPAGPINNLEDVFNDPQVLACKLVETVRHPILGDLKQVGLPLSTSHVEDGSSVRSAPPVFGQHTSSVFADYGFDPSEIERLLQQKVIHQAD